MSVKGNMLLFFATLLLISHVSQKNDEKTITLLDFGAVISKIYNIDCECDHKR